MDFREFEYFIEIAESKNLTHAAKKLYVSQPTLSKYIQRLEKETGIPLFSHYGKTLELTYAGQRYLSYARDFLNLKKSLENELLAIQQLDVGYLRIGMPPFRCSFALPAVLPHFHKEFPNVEIEIIESNSNKLDAMLKEGLVDLVFYNLSDPHQEFGYETLQEEDMYVIAPKGHTFANNAYTNPETREISLEGLSDEILLLQSREQRQGAYIRNELKAKKIVPKKIIQNTNIRSCASLAAGGYGIAFLSGALLRQMEPFCEFDSYRLVDCTTKIRFVAAWRLGYFLPNYAKAFIRMMKETS